MFFSLIFFLQRISFAAALSAAFFINPPCQANTTTEEVGDTRNRKISGWRDCLFSLADHLFFFRPFFSEMAHNMQ